MELIKSWEGGMESIIEKYVTTENEIENVKRVLDKYQQEALDSKNINVLNLEYELIVASLKELNKDTAHYLCKELAEAGYYKNLFEATYVKERSAQYKDWKPGKE